MSRQNQSCPIRACLGSVHENYNQMFGSFKSEYADTASWIANIALQNIARSDAPYHDVEHTILVTGAGQDILRGKQLLGAETISPEDWLNTTISLLCHDIGYVRGVCRGDRPRERRYATARGDGETVYLPEGRTDASLTPYHVDRSQKFVRERFAAMPHLDIGRICENIELTRFPVPDDGEHDDTRGYPGLARAADLIGQLADPDYLPKTAGLFREFEETGANQKLGYRTPADLRAGYPNFFKFVVYQYIEDSFEYLQATPSGRDRIVNLYQNVTAAENEVRDRVPQPSGDGTPPPRTKVPSPSRDGSFHSGTQLVLELAVTG